MATQRLNFHTKKKEKEKVISSELSHMGNKTETLQKCLLDWSSAMATKFSIGL